MIPIPKTKVAEIASFLQPYIESRAAPDEFTLQRLKREIEKVASVDRTGTLFARAMIAVLEWDEDEIHALFRRSLNVHDQAEIHERYAIALQMMGNFKDASREAQLASMLNPTDLSALRRAISYTNLLGDMEMAKKLCDDYKLRSPTSPYIDEEALIQTSKVLTKSGTSLEVVKKCNAIAFSVLKNARTPFKGIRYESDDEDSSVMLFIDVDRNAEEVEKLDRELGQRLFDDVPDFHPSHYWVGFEKYGVNV